MKIVLPGGTGQVGGLLRRALAARGHDVVVLSRRPEALEAGVRRVLWDGRTLGAWAAEGDGADAVVNLAGRTVSCRYTDTDLRQMMDSRVDSTRATPGTRKVQLRTAMVMTPDRGGILDHLSWMARLGLGGPVDGGAQHVSWIHGQDFVRAVELLLDRDDVEGPVNLAAPEPLPQRQFMRVLRRAWGQPVGLPATELMAEVGALVLRTDTELLLKSCRVVPGRLLEAGFGFEHPTWQTAARDLVAERRASATS